MHNWPSQSPQSRCMAALRNVTGCLDQVICLLDRAATMCLPFTNQSPTAGRQTDCCTWLACHQAQHRQQYTPALSKLCGTQSLLLLLLHMAYPPSTCLHSPSISPPAAQVRGAAHCATISTGSICHEQCTLGVLRPACAKAQLAAPVAVLPGGATVAWFRCQGRTWW